MTTDPEQPRRHASLRYPVEVKVRMTEEMRARIEAQSAANGGLGLVPTIRLGLSRWLTAAEGAGTRRQG